MTASNPRPRQTDTRGVYTKTVRRVGRVARYYQKAPPTMNRGLLYAAGGYLLWGLFPLYWKPLQHVPALEILAHRIVWALLFTLALTLVRRNWAWLGQALRTPRTLLTFIASTLLLSTNWGVYIWAVNAGFVVETSLGYFMNPLVNVALGMLILRERLRWAQIVAVAIALAGVLYLTFLYGAPPWIALTLALSFGAYGLLRKTASLDSLQGLTFETLLIMPPALIYLLFLEFNGSAAFGHVDWLTTLMLAGAGAVTAIPLLLFAAGARQITLTTLGLLQYLAPTLQFLLGVTVFGESVSPQQLVGFGFVWFALAIYTFDSLNHAARRPPKPGVGTATPAAR